MPSLTVIEIVVRALEEEGVTHIFGVPGGPLVPLYEALAARERIRPVLAKHEAGAAFMAEGYARVRRGLGVCCATSGPGATNALTGIASAQSDSIPVLLLSGQVATTMFGKGAVQDGSGGNRNVQIVDIYRSACKCSAMLSNSLLAPHLIRQLLRAALTGRRGAVHLNIPADLMKQSVPLADVSSVRYRPQAAPSGDRLAIKQAANLLREARRPVILAGHGVNLAGAWAPLVRLAEALAIPVATTLKGKSAFPELHPLSLGVFGFGGHPLADDYLLSQEIDVLLFVGTSLGEFQTHRWLPELAHGRTIIQIDLDPQEIGKNYPIDVGIVGDASLVLDELLEQISPSDCVQVSREHAPLQHVSCPGGLRESAEQLQGQSTLLKPQALVAKMYEILPAETLLFVDTGNSLCWAGRYYTARQPGTIFIALNMAPVGYAVAASIGGKLAAPDRPVVALVGDGAFAMHGMEVHTAVDYRVPVIWVVLNNGGHGMVYNGETLICGRSFESLFRTPLDVCTIARGLGAQAFKATTLAEFSESLRLALEAQEPCVIDAYVDLEESPPALQGRVTTLQALFEQGGKVKNTEG